MDSFMLVCQGAQIGIEWRCCLRGGWRLLILYIKTFYLELLEFLLFNLRHLLNLSFYLTAARSTGTYPSSIKHVRSELRSCQRNITLPFSISATIYSYNECAPQNQDPENDCDAELHSGPWRHVSQAMLPIWHLEFESPTRQASASVTAQAYVGIQHRICWNIIIAHVNPGNKRLAECWDVPMWTKCWSGIVLSHQLDYKLLVDFQPWEPVKISCLWQI